MIETATDSLQGITNVSPETITKLASTILIIIALWLLHTLAIRFINRQTQSNRTLYSWRKATQYIIVILGIFLVGRTWLVGMQSVVTYLGLLSAGIAIALQDLVINLAGWAFIMWVRPFAVGDRIQIGDDSGDVIDIRLFQFSMLEIGKRIDAEQTTGRILHLPNGIVFKEVFANYSQGFPYIWNEMPILVTYESDWQKAKGILQEIISRHAPDVSEDMKKHARRITNRFVISYGTTSPIVYTQIASSGVLLTMRYLVAPRQRRNSENAIYEDILREFANHWDIDFAYETNREFDHYLEGKKRPQTSQNQPSESA
ncbi:MAG: mechanosensitive ion channel family protein [Ardenticatenaceae bacterium]|nr:mechanosensitive ion channel family protein [Ardenticatenaceae bacterium]